MSADTLPTVAEVTKRLDALHADIAAARANVESTHDELQKAVVRGASELEQARAQKALDDAKARLAALEERIGLLDRALDEAMSRAAEAKRQEQVRAGQALLDERCIAFDDAEAALNDLAVALSKILKLSAESVAAFPKRPDWLPPSFTPHSLSVLTSKRLCALTEGHIRAPHNTLSLYELKQMPSLSERGVLDRTEVMQQFGVIAPAVLKKARGVAARS
jgi:hypothetical protein